MAAEFLTQVRGEMARAYGASKSGAGVQGSSLAEDSAAPGSAALRSAIAALGASYALVGQLPPEPPTFRGRMGARLVKLVKRGLFWYTPQIVYFQYSALRAIEELAKSLDRAEERIRYLEDELAEAHAQNGRTRGEGCAPKGAPPVERTAAVEESEE